MATSGSVPVAVGSNGDNIVGVFPLSHNMHHFTILINTLNHGELEQYSCPYLG